MTVVKKIEAQIVAKDNATGVIKKVEKSTFSLKNAVKGLAVAYGATKIKQFISESIQLFEVQERAESRLAASVENLKDLGGAYANAANGAKMATDELKRYAAELQRSTTFGDEAIISAQALLGTFQLSVDEIKLMSPALLDMAAATEKTTGAQADLNDLANAMGKALNSGVGALSRYGVALTDTQKKQYDLATGAEKTALLVEILTDNFGGSATALAETTSGQLDQVANRWDDLKEEVGAAVAPMLLTIVNFAVLTAENFRTNWAKMIAAWGEFWVGFFNKWYEAKDIFSKAWGDMWAAIKSVYDATIGPMIDGIAEFINMITTAISKLDIFNSKKGSVASKASTRTSGKRAAGGYVSAGSSYTVGERGQETFTPSVNGVIGKNGAGGAINIIINGTVSSRQVAEEYGDILLRKLQLSTKVV